jgi:hypothetical protein
MPICLPLSQVLVLGVLWTRDTHPQGSVRDFVGAPLARRQPLVQPVATQPQLSIAAQRPGWRNYRWAEDRLGSKCGGKTKG